MKSFRWIAAGLLVLSAITCPAQAQTDKVIAIRAGHLFDSKSGKAARESNRSRQRRQDHRCWIRRCVQIPADAQVIDLSKSTVLPGLIDGHTHVFGFGLDGIKPGGPPLRQPD